MSKLNFEDHRPSTDTTVMSQNTTSINDLPNEILITTFEFLYKMHRRQESTGMEYWMTLPDAFTPSAFPFAQAKVCRRWCALLAHFPEYWTRIPITVGPAPAPAPTSLEDVANYFRWSQFLPVSVSVESRPRPPTGNVQIADEKSRVAAVLPHILQHLPRIIRIQFDLVHPTSIPDLCDWLIGEAHLLTSIILYYPRKGDTEPTLNNCEGDTNNEDVRELRFSAPLLTSLCIDSRTFARACSSSKTLAWLASAPLLRHMNLISPGGRSRMEHLSIRNTIEVLSHASDLRYLAIQGIIFAPATVAALSQPLHYISATSLTLEDLGGTDAATFIRAADGAFEDLTINNCSLLGLSPFLTGDLYLETLGEEHNLEELFTRVATHRITLHNSPAFNNAIIDFMANGGESGDDFPVMAMSRLALTQCTNFDVENLYQMILARRRAMEASPAWDGTLAGLAPDELDELSAIVSLSVTDGPFLSDLEMARFEQLVPDFEWTDPAIEY